MHEFKTNTNTRKGHNLFKILLYDLQAENYDRIFVDNVNAARMDTDAGSDVHVSIIVANGAAATVANAATVDIPVVLLLIILLLLKLLMLLLLISLLIMLLSLMILMYILMILLLPFAISVENVSC